MARLSTQKIDEKLYEKSEMGNPYNNEVSSFN